MSVIHAPPENPVTLRHLVLPGLLLLAMVSFFFRLWYLQVVVVDDYRREAENSGRIVDRSLAPRGKILDRNGELLADVSPAIVIMVKPADVAANDQILPKLASILDVPVKKLDRAVKQRWSKGGLPVPVYVGATVQQAARIAESGELLPGVSIRTLAMRRYANSKAAPHIMGWVSVPSDTIEERLKSEGLVPADYVGRDGIETSYERNLMGVPGSNSFAVDRRGRPLRSLASEEAIPGDTLILSLDLRLQKLANELLEGRKGAIVMLDPRNGEVLTMASAPSYDLKTFEGGLTDDEVEYLYQNKDRPMLKRAIAGRYPPGSTFKIVTAMAAFEAGKFNPSSSLSCPGYLQLGNRRIRCENHPPTSYSFNMAFTKSCNTYFGNLARIVGDDLLRETTLKVGLGAPLGIDMIGESGGRVPDEEHIKKVHKRPWSVGDTVNVGIGQGDLEVTPLQMASLAGMVAMHGVQYRPHLVRARWVAGDKAKVVPTDPSILRRFEASDSFWNQLQGAMRNVVVNGTARAAAIESAAVAGKTGSAENPVSRRTHAWFVGYAPADNPQIAFAILVETAGHGGEIAAPMAKRLLQSFFSQSERQSAENKPKISVKVSPLPEEAP
ncbi:penicillin-binding protein 2 [Kamptonema cortianum]|nr:penicillin-binding protein 2 [Geitlerinema splendidum]MDK3158401.1 penicillin-binding protein 2 [Kamptonema cortianum]